jgi:hypothetical protein
LLKDASVYNDIFTKITFEIIEINMELKKAISDCFAKKTPEELVIAKHSILFI